MSAFIKGVRWESQTGDPKKVDSWGSVFVFPFYCLYFRGDPSILGWVRAPLLSVMAMLPHSGPNAREREREREGVRERERARESRRETLRGLEDKRERDCEMVSCGFCLALHVIVSLK